MKLNTNPENLIDDNLIKIIDSLGECILDDFYGEGEGTILLKSFLEWKNKVEEKGFSVYSIIKKYLDGEELNLDDNLIDVFDFIDYKLKNNKSINNKNNSNSQLSLKDKNIESISKKTAKLLDKNNSDLLNYITKVNPNVKINNKVVKLSNISTETFVLKSIRNISELLLSSNEDLEKLILNNNFSNIREIFVNDLKKSREFDFNGYSNSNKKIFLCCIDLIIGYLKECIVLTSDNFINETTGINSDILTLKGNVLSLVNNSL